MPPTLLAVDPDMGPQPLPPAAPSCPQLLPYGQSCLHSWGPGAAYPPAFHSPRPPALLCRVGQRLCPQEPLPLSNHVPLPAGCTSSS